MKATFIFDNVNNILFSKWDNSFTEYMKSLNEECPDLGTGSNITDKHYLSQHLSPVITSQRVMAVEFGNTYASLKCRNDSNIVFDEWLDYAFMAITKDNVDDAHREILDCKTFVQHICGQNIGLLDSPIYEEWLSVLLESRTKGDYVPGASGVIGESGATVAALNGLKNISKEIKCSPYQHYHIMLFVGDKMLALYSSRGSEDIMPSDLILLSIQCVAAQEHWENIRRTSESASENSRLPWLSKENSAIIYLCAGSSGIPCAPHSLHIGEIAPRVIFAVVIDMEFRDIGIPAHMSSEILANLRRLLLRGDLELLPAALESLETALKKTVDALRKNRAYSSLCGQLTSRMSVLHKSCTTTTPVTPETAAVALHTTLGAVIDQLRPKIPSLKMEQPLKDLRGIMAPFVDFLRVKAMRYFSLSPGETEVDISVSLHKYVEEFPGLIHFVYVDRTTGRFLAPDLADCADLLTPQMMRDVMRRTLSSLREGYGAATWRSGAIHACVVQWSERRGAPAYIHSPHPATVRALPPPGDILGTFHRQFLELAFPYDSQGISIKELICVHLGLLPASTAVQQARRLAHSIYEFAGENPAIASDLL